MSLLEVAGLRAGYGAAEVLHGIDLSVAEGSAAEIQRDPVVVEAYLGSAA